jgi:hypothetical protein
VVKKNRNAATWLFIAGAGIPASLLDLEPTDILGGRTIRGAAKEGGETRDDALIVVLGLR